jgi:protein-S-isoprenylcysteine O-methyltransferase Ste14
MACAFLGLSLRVWAAGHLHKHKSLATQGPYRWTRNPLYLGSFIMGLGFMVAASEIFLFLLFICLFLLIYIPVMRREEGELVAAYGEDYTAYKARVPLLFPSTRNWPKCEPSNFSWHQVILNREYKAVLGFCLITVFLVLSAVD